MLTLANQTFIASEIHRSRLEGIRQHNCTPSNFGLALALPSRRAPKRRLSCPAGAEQRSTFRLNANGTMHLVARVLWTTYHHA